MKEELKKEILELVKNITNESNRLYEIFYKDMLLISKQNENSDVRPCMKCGRLLSIDHFYASQTHRSHVTCKDCYREYERRHRIKKQIESLNEQLKKIDVSLNGEKNE